MTDQRRCDGCEVEWYGSLSISQYVTRGGKGRFYVCPLCAEAEELHVLRRRKVLRGPGKKGT